MRLSAPTNKTFLTALLLIVAGIVLWIDPLALEVDPDLPFWVTAAGGILLVAGSLFNKI